MKLILNVFFFFSFFKRITSRNIIIRVYTNGGQITFQRSFLTQLRIVEGNKKRTIAKWNVENISLYPVRDNVTILLRVIRNKLHL